ncbi:MAG: hypothetical protein AAF614_38665, partial [Chloroflexota bacterium]
MSRKSYQLLRKQTFILLACLLFVSNFQAASAAPGDVERVSVNSIGVEGNSWSGGSSISENGRFVAFASYASNLVSGDTNNTSDVFVHDRWTGITERVSVSSSGAEGNNESLSFSISANGRFVAFASIASNLVSGDTNGFRDIFVHDRQTKMTTRVSVNNSGTEGNHRSSSPSISTDGRFVAFASIASNLVSGDNNSRADIFIHDRQTEMTTRVSVGNSGMEGNNFSQHPSISADGRFVAFASAASNLVSGDNNSQRDIFVRDREEDTTIRVSVGNSGMEGNHFSLHPSISADGRFV